MAESRRKSQKNQPQDAPVAAAAAPTYAGRSRVEDDLPPPEEPGEEHEEEGDELPSMQQDEDDDDPEEVEAPEAPSVLRPTIRSPRPTSIHGIPDLTPEGLKEFEQGVGHPVEQPDDEGLMKSRQREVDMSPMRRPRFNPDDKSLVDAADTARKMGALGNVLRMRVKRMSPEDMPPEESGISDWIPIPRPNPSFEDCEKIIRDRYGGGRYHVTLKSADVESEDDFPRVIELGGDPIPHTIVGRMWFQRRYGVIPQSPSGSSPSPTNFPAGADPTAMSTVKMMLDLLENRERREQVDRDRKDGREANLAQTVIQALSPHSQPTTNYGSLILQAMPVVLAFLKDSREERRRDREDSERRFEKVLERVEKREQPRQPTEILEAMQAVLSIVKTRAESEMKMALDQQGKVFDHMLKTMRDGGREEDASILGALAHAIKERGGDLLAGIGPWISQMMSGASAAQLAQQQGINPQLAAARGQRLLPAAAPTQQQAPMPTRRTVVSPPAAPQAAEGAPPTIPAPAPVEGAPAPAEPPQQSEGGTQDPAEFAAMMAADAMQRFLYYLNVFLVSQPDPDAAWALVMDGQAVETLFGVTPMLFRQRVSDDKFTSVSSWVDGVQSEEIVRLAGQADERCQGDPACARWLVAFLDTGPWVEEEDGDDDDRDDLDKGM